MTPARSLSRQAGMTLVEVMLVIFIVGLVAGVAVTTLPERESREEAAVRELGETLRGIQDQAILTGDVLALRAAKGEITLMRWDGFEWQSVDKRLIDLPQAVDVELSRSGERRPPARRRDEATMLVFDPLGVTEPVDITLTAGRFARTLRITEDGEVVNAAAS